MLLAVLPVGTRGLFRHLDHPWACQQLHGPSTEVPPHPGVPVDVLCWALLLEVNFCSRFSKPGFVKNCLPCG